MSCKDCGSFAINHHKHGRDGSDGDLCDVCYWRKRASHSPHEPQASDYERAMAEEIEHISNVPYDSHAICRHFMGCVQNRARAIALERGKSATIKDSLTVGHSDD